MAATIITDFMPSITFDENTVNTSPQILDADVSLTTTQTDFDGAFLALTGILPEDSVSIKNVGTGSGEVGLSGTDVTFGGVTIGTISGGNGTDLTITFNADTSAQAIEVLIENLSYANNSDTPTTSRDLALSMTNADGTGFTELNDATNPLDDLDVGSGASPTFVDLDGDGDMDLISGADDGTLKVYDNNDADDGFTELTGVLNPFDGIDVGTYSLPTFTDLDGDGDMDLVLVERQDETIRFYENTDADDSFTFLDSIFTGYSGRALLMDTSFSDLDGDGDLDMVIGDRDGFFRVYDKNDADDGFTQLVGTSNPLEDIQLGVYSFMSSTFVDLDNDGDMDLVIGDYFGRLRVFDNNDSDDKFTELTGAANPFDGIDVGNTASPSFVDLDGDGDQDLVVGNNSGTFSAYENETAGEVSAVIVTVSVTPEDEINASDGIISGTNAADTIDSATFVDPDGDTVNDSGQIINGLGGHDIIIAGSGDDIIDGGTHYDTIDAGAGNDEVWGGNGRDTVTLGAGDDIFHDNNQTGNHSHDTVYGGEGHDRINGGGGNDTFFGDAGNDVISGGIDNDTLSGGAGADTFTFIDWDGSDTITDFDTTTDTIIINGVTVESGELPIGISLVQTGSGVIVSYGGDDSIQLHGIDLVAWLPELNTSDGIVSGTSGADTINSNTVVDPDGDTVNDSGQTIYGLGGHDIITAGGGDDIIDGGTHYDTIDAGAGNDEVWGGNGQDTVMLGAGDDIFHDNTQTGRHAHDTVYGGDGDDTFNGGGGNDIFAGDAGNDTLLGGIGNDSLSGGAGADIFAFSLGDDSDVVTDFENGIDIIDFLSTDLSFGDLTITTDANGSTIVDYGTGDQIELLNTSGQIDQSDFIFA